MANQYTIPQTLEERTQLRKALRDFVQKQNLCPPVSLKQLEELADAFIASFSMFNGQWFARPKDACYPLGRRTLATKGTQERDARNLQKGLYIVNGRKFIVK